MPTSSLRSSQPVEDSNFFAALMPNRGRTKFLRGVILLFLFIGAIVWIVIAADIFSEFHARHSWPIAQGHVTAAHEKSYRGPSLRDRTNHYFVEYEVRFAVPTEQCLTGMTWVIDREHPLCEGIARTRTTSSQTLANSWLERHPFNAPVEILHDPNGHAVKIVGESADLVYPWNEIFPMSLWMIFFLIFFTIAQRRLQFLRTLPEDYKTPSPPSSKPTGANDLIDLKL